jgi:diphosphomevalonate decarboxylase
LTSIKATARAPSNLAFVKYWGKKDETLRLPANASISMNLSHLVTTTTVEFIPSLATDELVLNGQSFSQNTIEWRRVAMHLDRLRKISRASCRARVVSENSFPDSTGLSSSASGFAALTVAGTAALGLELRQEDLSILARQASGSACRSIPDGFVEWLDGDTSETSFAISLFPPDYWDIVDVVALVSDEKKDISSSVGQQVVNTSPFFPVRLARIKKKLDQARELLRQKDFSGFGELLEAEAVEMHAIMLTSTPSLMYWLPGSVHLMRLVRQWRADGLPVYFSVNTGQDIHLICRGQELAGVVEKLKAVPVVRDIIVNRPAAGARLVEDHLF